MAEWNVWHGRVNLAELPHSDAFAVTKRQSLSELPRKDALLADLTYLAAQSCSIALMFIDLDNFKSVNDTMGHDAGDLCIERAADVIGSCVLHKGRVYRYASGDEFMVILPNFDDKEASASAERIRKGIEAEKLGGPSPVTASIGVIVMAEGKHMTATESLKAADEAMYQAKQSRNTVFVTVI